MTDFTGTTSYPGALDAFDTTKDNGDAIGQDLVDARAAIGAIEAELGIDPSGDQSTVKARLDTAIRVLAQSAAAITAPADTVENALATIAVPANAMGANGRLRISTFWTCTSNANVKTVRCRFSGAAGTIFASENLATVALLELPVEISNRGVANSQHGRNVRLGLFAAATGTTAAVDTTAATTIVISVQKATAGDTVKLESYSVELIPG